MPIEFKKFSSAAHVPKRVHNTSAGYDIWCAEKVILKPWSRNVILTDLKLAIPEGYCGRVVMVHNGAIDSDYHGIVGVILFNFCNEEYVIERGDRIAQMIIERLFTRKFGEVREFNKENTERGEGGFGSTGVLFSYSLLLKKLVKNGIKVSKPPFIRKKIISLRIC